MLEGRLGEASDKMQRMGGVPERDGRVPERMGGG